MSQIGNAIVFGVGGGLALFLIQTFLDIIKAERKWQEAAMASEIKNELRSWMRLYLSGEVSSAKAEIVSLVHALFEQESAKKG